MVGPNPIHPGLYPLITAHIQHCWTRDDSTIGTLVVPETTLGFVVNGRTIVVGLQKLLTLNAPEKASEVQSFD